MSYEEVTDVEKGLTEDDTLIARARQRYPAANSDIEALFLGRLDDAIENVSYGIKIPRIQMDQFGHVDGSLTSFTEVLKSLKLPTCALVITVFSAVLSILSNNPLFKAAVPYLSCILTFLSTVPSVRERFLAKASSLLAKFDSMKRQVEDRIDGVASRGLQLLHTTETTMDNALAPINAKLAALTQIESMLKKVKPDIDIPDPSDVKRSFAGFQQKLETGFSSARNAINVSRSLPSPFQSAKNFELYIVIPYLAVMLAIQLIVLYNTLAKQSDSSAEKNTLDEDEGVNDSDLIWTALQAYTTSVVQILLVFVLTQAQSLIFFVNKEIEQFEGNMNKELRRTVGDVFENIFRRGFKLVKSKFLDLLNRVNRLEEPIHILQEKFPDILDKPEFSEVASFFKTNATVKLQKKRENILHHLGKIFGR